MRKTPIINCLASTVYYELFAFKIALFTVSFVSCRLCTVNCCYYYCYNVHSLSFTLNVSVWSVLYTLYYVLWLRTRTVEFKLHTLAAYCRLYTTYFGCVLVL